VATAAIARLATYRRVVRASLPRIWENVLDWEHLPWLHRTTFADVALLESGRDGWRAGVGLQPAATGRRVVLETVLERARRRYVARTLEGPGAGAEIWTHLEPLDGGRTAIEVTLSAPPLPAARAEATAAAWVRLYTRLWDEDEAMMVRRETLLAAPARGRSRALVEIGALDAVRARLPLVVDCDGHAFRVVEVDGALVAHATVCPHRMGPLDEAPVEDGCVRCPWHGYRFDVRTGASRDAIALALDPAPTVEVDAATHAVRLRPA
jgi:nitrite reductase/ring-hydroxylating ferredoxin subunit